MKPPIIYQQFLTNLLPSPGLKQAVRGKEAFGRQGGDQGSPDPWPSMPTCTLDHEESGDWNCFKDTTAVGQNQREGGREEGGQRHSGPGGWGSVGHIPGCLLRAPPEER